jgi:hypothetical protein
MRLFRGLGGGLLWILGAVVGLVGAVLCVTVILLPLGIPVLRLAGRMMRGAVQLMLPRAISHPVEELGKAGRAKADGSRRAARRARKVTSKARRGTRKRARRLRKKVG